MSKTKKRPYMVAMTKKFTIETTVYFETVASSSEEAEIHAREHLNETSGAKYDEWLEEARVSLDHKEYEVSKAKVKCVGPSSDYHSAEECKICRDHRDGKN
jgi:hypothetical protein